MAYTAVSQVIVCRVVEFTHQTVNVRWSVPSDIGYEQCDQLRRDMVKDGTVSTNFGQNLTYKRRDVLLSIYTVHSWGAEKSTPYLVRMGELLVGTQTCGRSLLHWGTEEGKRQSCYHQHSSPSNNYSEGGAT